MWPGSYEVCPICYWEDDPVQILDPWFKSGANGLSLVEAQRNYIELGAMEVRFLKYVRSPLTTEEQDPNWRPVSEDDKVRARTPAALTDANHQDLRAWHYWLNDRGGDALPVVFPENH